MCLHVYKRQAELSKGKFQKGQVSDLFEQQGLSCFVGCWANINSVGQKRMTGKVKLNEKKKK